jgi:hypothetical protein
MKEKRTSAAEAGCNGNTYGTGEPVPLTKQDLFQDPLSKPELYSATAARILNHTQHESRE